MLLRNLTVNEFLFWTQMSADYQDFKYKELTENIIKIFYRVYNKLGYGFLEKIYENAMMIELKKEGVPETLKLAFYLILALNQKLNVRHLIILENSYLRSSATICVLM